MLNMVPLILVINSVILESMSVLKNALLLVV